MREYPSVQFFRQFLGLVVDFEKKWFSPSLRFFVVAALYYLGGLLIPRVEHPGDSLRSSSSGPVTGPETELDKLSLDRSKTFGGPAILTFYFQLFQFKYVPKFIAVGAFVFQGKCKEMRNLKSLKFHPKLLYNCKKAKIPNSFCYYQTNKLNDNNLL